MATHYISEAEVLRDFGPILQKLRAGGSVVIESEDAPAAVLTLQSQQLEESEEGHDEWFRAAVQAGLESDPAEDIDGEVVEAYFAEKRRADRALLESMGK